MPAPSGYNLGNNRRHDLNFAKTSEFIYKQLEEDLRESILKGNLDFSSPIKSEFQLCEDYKISRKSVRKALENLTADGLLKKIQGKGTFPVAPQKRIHALSPAKLKIQLSAPGFYMSTDEYTEEIIAAISDRALKEKHTIEYSDENVNIDDCRNEGINGIIFIRPAPEIQEKISSFNEAGIPVIFINSSAPNAYSIVSDTEAELEETISLLNLLGHKKIAFLNVPYKNYISLHRRDAFFKAAEKFELHDPESMYAETTRDNILKVLHELFHNEAPTALITGGHHLMGGVLNFCRKYKLNLPDDLSLISINDSCIARNYTVPISVFKEPLRDTAELALKILESISDGNEPPEKFLKLKGDLLVRKSCGHPRAGRLKI